MTQANRLAWVVVGPFNARDFHRPVLVRQQSGHFLWVPRLKENPGVIGGDDQVADQWFIAGKNGKHELSVRFFGSLWGCEFFAGWFTLQPPMTIPQARWKSAIRIAATFRAPPRSRNNYLVRETGLEPARYYYH